MTTDDRVMAILERANPVPTGELVDVPIGVTRYLETALEQRSEPMTIIDPTPTRSADQSPRRHWPLFAAAASVVALVVASIALVVATRDDATVVDQPDPTVPPTIAPVPTTAATDVGEAQGVIDSFFSAYRDGDTDATLALMSSDVSFTDTHGFGPPFPEEDGLGDIELNFAWNHAQGEVWTEPTCSLAEEQRAAGTTMSCQWETMDAPVLALDSDSIPTDSLIVVSDGRIVELHLGYGPIDFARLGTQFGSWMEEYHPEVEGADCCAGDTRADSERRGVIRAQWAEEWAAWLDEWGCDTVCTITEEEWVAEYDSACTALEPPDLPSAELVDQLSNVPGPRLLRRFRDALVEADRALIEPGLTPERIAELQQIRLGAMVELGIDEACHPQVG